VAGLEVSALRRRRGRRAHLPVQRRSELHASPKPPVKNVDKKGFINHEPTAAMMKCHLQRDGISGAEMLLAEARWPRCCGVEHTRNCSPPTRTCKLCREARALCVSACAWVGTQEE